MENSDDYDFAPSGNSKLASLFNSSSLFSEESKLTYTAPKQPRPDTKSESASTDSSVICARVVQVWKLTNGKYVSIGKLGLAIIGSSTHNSYEVILYKDKRNVIIRVRIIPAFEIFLKKDNFISFYDSAKDNWLVKFGSDEDYKVIINHIEKFGGKVSSQVEEETLKSVTEPQNHHPNIHKDATSDNEEKDKSGIFNESFENKAKVDILSRIAKMGQAILPSKTTEPEDDSGSTDSNETKISENQQLVSPTAVHVHRPVQTIPSTFVMGQPMAYDPLNLYFTENRTHNTEVRMNLTQISEKLNNLMKLVENEKPDSDTNALKSKIKVLHLTNDNLSRELGKIQSENVKLKTEVSREASLKKVVEDSQLELKLAKEREELRAVELVQEVNLYKNTSAELSRRVEDLEKKLSEKENSISQLEVKLFDFEKLITPTTENDKTAEFIAVLKNTMNGMYGNIMENLQSETGSSKINSIIAQNIKSTTLNIIQNFQKIYGSPSDLN